MKAPQKDLTRKELAEIRRRVKATTPGPWKRSKVSPRMIRTEDFPVDDAPMICVLNNRSLRYTANAEFLAHARQDVLKLLAYVDTLKSCVEMTTSFLKPPWRRKK